MFFNNVTYYPASFNIDDLENVDHYSYDSGVMLPKDERILGKSEILSKKNKVELTFNGEKKYTIIEYKDKDEDNLILKSSDNSEFKLFLKLYNKKQLEYLNLLKYSLKLF